MEAQTSYAVLPASDLERAKSFYSEKLGLTPVNENPAGAFYELGGVQFFVTKSTGASPGDFTQLGVRVADIEAAVAELRGRGVAFEEYPNSKEGIMDTGPVRAAWFKDSEGNLIGVNQLNL